MAPHDKKSPSAEAGRPQQQGIKGYHALLLKASKVGPLKAAQVLRKACALMPERKEAHRELAYKLLRLGTDPTGAMKALLISVRLQTPDTREWASDVVQIWFQSKLPPVFLLLKSDPPTWWNDDGLRDHAMRVIRVHPNLFGGHLMLAEVRARVLAHVSPGPSPNAAQLRFSLCASGSQLRVRGAKCSALAGHMQAHPCGLSPISQGMSGCRHRELHGVYG